jgi:hypothetical protein
MRWALQSGIDQRSRGNENQTGSWGPAILVGYAITLSRLMTISYFLRNGLCAEQPSPDRYRRFVVRGARRDNRDRMGVASAMARRRRRAWPGMGSSLIGGSGYRESRAQRTPHLHSPLGEGRGKGNVHGASDLHFLGWRFVT